MITDIHTRVKIPKPIQLDISALPKGINNYQIDIHISDEFKNSILNTVKELVFNETSENKHEMTYGNLFTSIRENYLEMMTALIHRTKTDLDSNEIQFVQFSIPKFILCAVKDSLEKLINIERKKSAQLSSYGPKKILSVHEHLSWLSKNFNIFYYNITKQIFNQLRSVEEKKLIAIRKQYLGIDAKQSIELLYNPMLMTRDLHLPTFLIEQGLYWTGHASVNEYHNLNFAIEKLSSEVLPEVEFTATTMTDSTIATENSLYDVLGGLSLAQNFLGPFESSGENPNESLCWIDEPKNIVEIFNLSQFKQTSVKIRKEHGVKVWLQALTRIKKFQKSINYFTQQLRSSGLLLKFIATYQTRHIWTTNFSNKVEIKQICLFLSKSISQEQLLRRVSNDQKFTSSEIELLKLSAREVENNANQLTQEMLVKILSDISQFRLQIKKFRFAHKIFNKINILTDPKEIYLSEQANTLYSLPLTNELPNTEKIVTHHAILKTDIRGSTRVIQMLEKNDLNPASYFSLRFFDPINKILTSFGANKIFIRDNAIVLSFLEHEKSPQEWFSVAHACGVARGIINIIKANNRYSKEMGLPLLEVGIGISYSNETPNFLYDGDQAIMISPAIALADRDASCTYKLRETLKPEPFSVEVFEIPQHKPDRGGKGQRYIRYNVNGILLRTEAFEKLKTEIDLKSIRLIVNNQNLDVYFGTFPDLDGRKKDIVIREASIGLWTSNGALSNPTNKAKFYEVISNSSIISMVREYH